MTDRIRVGTMLIEDGTLPWYPYAGNTGRRYRALFSRLVVDHGMHQRATRQGNRKCRLDIFLHGWRDSHKRLRLQRSIPDSSCYDTRDPICEAGALQLFGDYSNETAIISGFVLHEPGRSRQTHSKKSKLSQFSQDAGQNSVSFPRVATQATCYGSEQVLVRRRSPPDLGKRRWVTRLS